MSSARCVLGANSLLNRNSMFRARGCNPSCVDLCLARPPPPPPLHVQWVPEIKYHAPAVPFLLVGTKVDLRSRQSVAGPLSLEGKLPVTPEEATLTASATGAVGYVECSARAHQGLEAVFTRAVTAGLSHKARASQQTRRKKICSIL